MEKMPIIYEVSTLIPVPHIDTHQKFINQLKTDSKFVGSHTFPVDGRYIFIETSKTQDELKEFFQKDPYIKD